MSSRKVPPAEVSPQADSIRRLSLWFRRRVKSPEVLPWCPYTPPERGGDARSSAGSASPPLAVNHVLHYGNIFHVMGSENP